jgi:predicted RNA-binding protein YlxR (DUF448 family)
VGCGQTAPQSELVRFVLSDGGVVPDPERRLPGRGAYLHPRPECADLALRRRGFNRSFRGPVTIGPETVDLIDQWRRSASTR